MIKLAAILQKNTIGTKDLTEIVRPLKCSVSSIGEQYYSEIASLLCLGISNSLIDHIKGRWF